MLGWACLFGPRPKDWAQPNTSRAALVTTASQRLTPETLSPRTTHMEISRR